MTLQQNSLFLLSPFNTDTYLFFLSLILNAIEKTIYLLPYASYNNSSVSNFMKIYRLVSFRGPLKMRCVCVKCYDFLCLFIVFVM